MDWGATIVCIGGLRALLRFCYEGQVLFFPLNRAPVLIAGADESGEALLRALRLHRGMSYEVVGFITHDAGKARLLHWRRAACWEPSTRRASWPASTRPPRC